MTDWNGIAAEIGSVTGRAFRPSERQGVGGGCINATTVLGDGERSFFVKCNQAALLDMFEAEADGLLGLAESGAILVPDPICWGTVGATSYLVLERLELGGRSNGAESGRRLAELHRARASRFGWRRDNYIGSTPQHNPETPDWIDFFREHRLRFQLDLAKRNGHGRSLLGPGERLLADMAALIDHDPVPSLLHGDLWTGNLGYLSDGTPVIFDPAVYHGDREAEIAMSELFGGFGRDFYAAYNEAWPLDPGYVTRRTLYNRYHIINHLNLFGGSYLGQALAMMDRLLAEIR